MGMYDDIIFEDTCPTCGSKVTGFQSKDAECNLDKLNYWEVRNFYAPCRKCKTWIEYDLEGERPRIPLKRYKKTIEEPAE